MGCVRNRPVSDAPAGSEGQLVVELDEKLMRFIEEQIIHSQSG